MDTTTRDLESVRCTLEGSPEGFDELVRRYERLVFKIAFSYTRERESALDVTQNVFLKAYDRLSSFHAEGSFKAWLLRIAYHESINWVRSHSRRTQREESEEPTESFAANDDQERELLHRERWRLIEHSLEVLGHRSRLAVVLRYLQAMPIREIAAVLGCSEGVVKSMLFRGVRKMRDAVAETA